MLTTDNLLSFQGNSYSIQHIHLVMSASDWEDFAGEDDLNYSTTEDV